MSSSFLATTALDEFWNKDADRILFLGTWCLRFDSRHRWKTLRYEVLPSPWNDRRRFYEAAAYVDELGERLLPPLARYLNSVHGEQRSDRYWRILVGVWLMHAVHAAYDRYVLLSEAIGSTEVNTIGLDRSDYRVPTTTVDHHAALKNDLYNLQLFTQILEAKGYEFPRRKASSPPPPHALYRRSPLKRVVVSSVEGLARLGERLLEKPGRIAFYSSYGSWSAELRILLQSGFGVIPMHPPAVEIEREPVFDSRRLGLADLPASSPFERILVSLLPQLFPTIFLEGYRELVSSCAAPSVGGVASVSGWYFEEHVKCRAAILADRGAKIFALQHGGGYGIYRVAPAERYEKRLCDRFLVWGWAADDPKVRNAPGGRLSEIAKHQITTASASRNRSVLFVPTAHPRYLYRFHSSPVGSQWTEYFD
ncbi:MAG TPA: LIC12162 family protein, partial [Thermoanaerobaculia bacterium]|nr:LIC12162 family protein [Thermoanaerobaculia bacterium]